MTATAWVMGSGLVSDSGLAKAMAWVKDSGSAKVSGWAMGSGKELATASV